MKSAAGPFKHCRGKCRLCMTLGADIHESWKLWKSRDSQRPVYSSAAAGSCLDLLMVPLKYNTVLREDGYRIL